MGNRKILVLDVDETLLNIEPLFFLKKFKKDYKDYEGKLFFDEYYLSPRPNVKEFIKKAKMRFDLAAFSVVEREVTKKKLGELGILNDFIKIYGKEDLVDNKKSLKTVADDLKVDTKDVIAIDDTPDIFLEKDNVIRIEPWFIGGNKEDNAFAGVFEQLLEFESVKINSLG